MQKVEEAAPVRLLFVMSVGLIAIPVLKDQIRDLAGRGVDVHVAAAPEDALAEMVERQGGTFHPWGISRAVGGVRGELSSLTALRFIVKDLAPDILVAGTPKAGLLGMVVGRALRVPRVVYTMHGLRLEGASGAKRLVLWTLELLSCLLAHVVQCVGHDLADRAVKLRLVSRKRVRVVGQGSAAGIDVDRFRPSVGDEARRQREALGVPPDVPLVGFVGRVTHDKGIADLAVLMRRLAATNPAAHLVVIGGSDNSNKRDAPLVEDLRSIATVVMAGHQPRVEEALRVLDLMVLPSIREGLPTVVLEAAASRVPTVMYACTGARDAVVDGRTGHVVPMGDTEALVATVTQLLDDDRERQRLGTAAMERVHEEFASSVVVPALSDFYLTGAR